MKKNIFLFILFLTFSLWLSLNNYKTDYWNLKNDFNEYQQGVVNHTIFGPLAYRILIPYLIDYTHSFLPGWNEKHIDLFLNIILILLVQGVFYRYLKLFFSSAVSLIGTIWLDLALMMSMTSFLGIHVYETTDVCNILFMILAMHLMYLQKWKWLAVVLFVSMLNRETPAFLLLPLWMMVYRNKSLFKWILICTLAVVLPYSGLKLFIHPPQPTWFLTMYMNENIPFYEQGNLPAIFISYAKFFILLAGASVLAFSDYKDKNKFQKSFVVILPFYFVVHLIVAHVEEYRIWIPLFLFLIPLALESLQKNIFLHE